VRDVVDPPFGILLLPLFLFMGSLLTLILIFRNPGAKGVGVGTVLMALLAFGVGTCSALVGMPGAEVTGSARWPACIGLATMAVFAFALSLGSPGKETPLAVTQLRGATAAINATLVLLAIAMVVAAVLLLER
jgi:Kef-type K+ transport system membrane component KefB